MDPMTGHAGVAALRVQDGRAEVFVRLAPNGSICVRTFAERKAKGPYWPYLRTGGDPIPVEGPWTVEFIDGGPVAPPPCDISRLASWTEFSGSPDAASFAGTARYSIVLELPPKPAGDAWRLDLGAVAESARVRVNGIEAGAAILPPYRIDLAADLIKPGKNRIEIEVTSLSANRIRDLDRRGVEWRNFNDINFVNIDYKPFDASKWPLRPAGLLGPVTLTPLLDADIPR